MKPKEIPDFPADLCVIDRRKNNSTPPKERRAKGERRGMIDPTTCERPYTDDDIVFMKAMDLYKRDNRRPFPTWSEVLEVLSALGYRRVAEPTQMPGLSTETKSK